MREPLPAPAVVVSCPPPRLIQPAISIFPCVTTEAGGLQGRFLRPDAGLLRSAPQLAANPCPLRPTAAPLPAPASRAAPPPPLLSAHRDAEAPALPGSAHPAIKRELFPPVHAWGGAVHAAAEQTPAFRAWLSPKPFCFFFKITSKHWCETPRGSKRGHFLPGKRRGHRLLCSNPADGLRNEVGRAGSAAARTC